MNNFRGEKGECTVLRYDNIEIDEEAERRLEAKRED